MVEICFLWIPARKGRVIQGVFFNSYITFCITVSRVFIRFWIINARWKEAFCRFSTPYHNLKSIKNYWSHVRKGKGMFLAYLHTFTYIPIHISSSPHLLAALIYPRWSNFMLIIASLGQKSTQSAIISIQLDPYG